jgi:hypothetical protein
LDGRFTVTEPIVADGNEGVTVGVTLEVGKSEDEAEWSGLGEALGVFVFREDDADASVEGLTDTVTLLDCVGDGVLTVNDAT